MLGFFSHFDEKILIAPNQGKIIHCAGHCGQNYQEIAIWVKLRLDILWSIFRFFWSIFGLFSVLFLAHCAL